MQRNVKIISVSEASKWGLWYKVRNGIASGTHVSTGSRTGLSRKKSIGFKNTPSPEEKTIKSRATLLTVCDEDIHDKKRYITRRNAGIKATRLAWSAVSGERSKSRAPIPIAYQNGFTYSPDCFS